MFVVGLCFLLQDITGTMNVLERERRYPYISPDTIERGVVESGICRKKNLLGVLSDTELVCGYPSRSLVSIPF